ncbi:MAG: AzlC family ABC transporter permease [Pseudomonadota bacterium]
MIWGLPGQLVMVELASTGKGVVAAVFACSLANARFLPMVVSFLPQIANRSFTLVQLIIYAQLLSINSWAMCQRQFPTIEPAHRLFYYLVFATSILLAAAAGTLIGYHAAVALPNALVLGLIFSSPLFFALVLSSTARNAHRLALLLGCLMVPGLHAIFPSIDLLIAGAIGGSVAYCLRKRVERE